MIAIKGMEMPKSCSQCNLCVEDKYADMTCVLLCEEWEESDYNENHRDENCPLVEVVTCKDCKYNVKDGKNTTMCDIGHRFYMRDHDTFYCADGKRRE